VNGLTALDRHITKAVKSGVMTPDSLRLEARKLRRCAPELAQLGPPTRRLRRIHQMASKACGAFEQGARCDTAAAPVLAGYNPAAAPGAKMNGLLDCRDAGINKGFRIIAGAVFNASFIGPQS
jgi:hypothetical protein